MKTWGEKLDIVIATMPKISLEPLSAPALLKAAVEKNGFSCRTLDLNLDLWYRVKNTKMPELRIVIGGPAAFLVCEDFRKKKCIDAYILREGEIPVVGLLKGEMDAPGLNEKPALELCGLYKATHADYSDYNLDKYPSSGFNYLKVNYKNIGIHKIAITGSRGCINHCAYCNDNLFSPKYAYRSGKDIAREMIELNKKYPSIHYFNFTDSLINGNIREMRKMAKTLISYRKRSDSVPIGWEGKFACRPKNQMIAEDYAILSLGGFGSIGIRIESASENVRKKMNKLFTNEDMYFTIEQCVANKIKMTWGLIIAYPGETEADFQETLDFLSHYAYLLKKNLVNQINLGPTLSIMNDTWLYDHVDNLGISFPSGHRANYNWVHAETNSDFWLRYERWYRVRNHCLELGYFINDSEINELEAMLKNMDRFFY